MPSRTGIGNRAFPGSRHDHERCVRAALDRAVDVCASRSTRLTALRRHVLEIVWQSHRPLGAYAILERLRARGRRAAPPTVYRALEFLLAQGLVHRVESLNAFVGCARPGHGDEGQFLLCTTCGAAAELHDSRVEESVLRSAQSRGFLPRRQTIEVRGLCPDCRRKSGT